MNNTLPRGYLMALFLQKFFHLCGKEKLTKQLKEMKEREIGMILKSSSKIHSEFGL